MFKYIALAVAVACQFQIRVPVSEIGLTVNFTDPIVVILVAIAIFRFILNPSIASEFRTPLLWTGGLSLVLSIGLIVSLSNAGTWGILNRYVGWFVLLGYAGVGVWIVRADAWPAFRMPFVVTACALILLHTVTLFSYPYYFTGFHPMLLKSPEKPWQFVGFIGNSNAMSFFLLVVVGMVFCWMGLRRIYLFLILVVLFLGIAYTTSRSGIVGLVTIFIAAFAIKRDVLKPALGALAICVALLFTLQTILPALHGSMSFAMGKSAWDMGWIFQWKAPQVAESNMQLSSLGLRIDQTWFAIDQWKDSPVFGIGLGSFQQRYQDPSNFSSAAVLHNSALWLLTETGLVGLIAFLASFIWITMALYRQHRSGHEVIPLALLTLAVFAVLSQFHDLLYQRVLWLVIGLGVGGIANCGIKHKGETQPHGAC